VTLHPPDCQSGSDAVDVALSHADRGVFPMPRFLHIPILLFCLCQAGRVDDFNRPNVPYAFTGYTNSDIENGKIKKDAPPAQLYDLERDLKEMTNL
jgi:hypothetical protein